MPNWPPSRIERLSHRRAAKPPEQQVARRPGAILASTCRFPQLHLTGQRAPTNFQSRPTSSATLYRSMSLVSSQSGQYRKARISRSIREPIVYGDCRSSIIAAPAVSSSRNCHHDYDKEAKKGFPSRKKPRSTHGRGWADD